MGDQASWNRSKALAAARQSDRHAMVSFHHTRPEPRSPSPIAIKPPAPTLAPPSNLTQTIRRLDTGGADAAEHGAEEARDQGQEQGREEVPRHEKTDGLPGGEIGRQHAVDDLFEDEVHEHRAEPPEERGEERVEARVEHDPPAAKPEQAQDRQLAALAIGVGPKAHAKRQ